MVFSEIDVWSVNVREQRAANDFCCCVSKSIVTYCSPALVVIDLKTSFLRTTASSQSHCKRQVNNRVNWSRQNKYKIQNNRNEKDICRALPQLKRGHIKEPLRHPTYVEGLLTYRCAYSDTQSLISETLKPSGASQKYIKVWFYSELVNLTQTCLPPFP